MVHISVLVLVPAPGPSHELAAQLLVPALFPVSCPVQFPVEMVLRVAKNLETDLLR